MNFGKPINQLINLKNKDSVSPDFCDFCGFVFFLLNFVNNDFLNRQ